MKPTVYSDEQVISVHARSGIGVAKEAAVLMEQGWETFDIPFNTVFINEKQVGPAKNRSFSYAIYMRRSDRDESKIKLTSHDPREKKQKKVAVG